MQVDRVEFPSERGHLLRGRWHAALGRTRARVLFAHCFSCTAASRAAVAIARALARQGFDVLRFDFTGLGDSEGDFAAARAIHREWYPLMDVNFVETSPGPVKYAMSRMGLLEENYRLPMAPISDESRAKVDAVLSQLKPT